MSLIKRKDQSEFDRDSEYLRILKDSAASDREKAAASYELYTKYIPLIKKTARKFNLSKEDAEDFVSESYLIVMDVVDYTQMDKIDENYSFGYFLRFHLLNRGIQGVKKSQRQTKYMGSKISWEAMTEASNFLPESLMLTDDDAQEAVHSDADRAQVIRYLDTTTVFSKRDKDIVKDTLRGVSAGELADRYKLSRQRILRVQKEVAEHLNRTLSFN